MNNRKLIKKVIKTIKYDTDYCIEALEELLSFVPKENLIGYLGEDDVCPKCDQYPYSDTDKHCPICFDEIKKEEMKEIKMPIYHWEDEETNEKHYDFEEMANELENSICEALNRNVLITISEVEEK